MTDLYPYIQGVKYDNLFKMYKPTYNLINHKETFNIWHFSNPNNYYCSGWSLPIISIYGDGNAIDQPGDPFSSGTSVGPGEYLHRP